MPTPTLADRLAERIARRDEPVPPPPVSQEPAAVAGRVQHWLHATHRVRDARARQALTQMLLALAEAPEYSTSELGELLGLASHMATRYASRLAALELTDTSYRHRIRYHRLRRSAEDALLLVVQGQE